jgi:hypothetical protein
MRLFLTKLYKKLRESELKKAYTQSKKDISEGKYVIESVADHMKRISE